MQAINIISKFIKKYQIPISIGLSVLFVWLLFGIQKTPVTEKDLIKRDDELVKNVLRLMDEQIKEAEQRIEIRDKEIRTISKLIDSLSIVQKQNRAVLDAQIYKLNKMQDEIHIGNYTNATDSALLNRLRSGN